MGTSQWVALLDAATPALKGILAIAACVLGGKGLWDVLVKWLETRDNKDGREMAQEDAQNVRYVHRIAELEARQEPLIKEAALLGPCREECERLRIELIEERRKSDFLEHKNDHLETLKISWDFYMTSPEFLRKMADDIERRQREQGDGSETVAGDVPPG